MPSMVSLFATLPLHQHRRARLQLLPRPQRPELRLPSSVKALSARPTRGRETLRVLRCAHPKSLRRRHMLRWQTAFLILLQRQGWRAWQGEGISMRQQRSFLRAYQTVSHCDRPRPRGQSLESPGAQGRGTASLRLSESEWWSVRPPRRVQVERGTVVHTIVCEQRPRSTSQVRTVESNPQLTAFPPSENATAETRAVCERNTAEGAFVLVVPPSCTFRLFLRSGAAIVSSGTSSVSGIFVDHSPMSPSQPAVRMFFPS